MIFYQFHTVSFKLEEASDQMGNKERKRENANGTYLDLFKKISNLPLQSAKK